MGKIPGAGQPESATAKLLPEDRYAHVLPYRGTPGKRPGIIVDLDGTVALHCGTIADGKSWQHRGHYDYSLVHLDLPNEPIIELVTTLYNAGFDVVYLTGREDQCRDLTAGWLAGHIPGIEEYELYMRTTGDHRQDFLIKYDLFNAHIRNRVDVKFAFDDRAQVVKLWRAMGIPTLQVAEGDF